jgi:hypothetical protein
VTQSPQGDAIIRCPDGTSATIDNGAIGATGGTGASGTNGAIGATGAVGATGGTGAAGAHGATGATGASGSQGLGAGIATSLIPVGDPRCLAGQGGVVTTTFIDANNTGILECNDTITSVTYLCNGANGAAGAVGATGGTGADGAMGATGAVGATGASGAAGATGATGSDGAAGATGAAGADGSVGATGASGADGTSPILSLTQASSQECANGGWIVTVSGGSSEPICNGAPGAAAAPSSGMTLVEFIAPCGLASSNWKEELLAFSDGSLLADFSDNASGSETRLALISDGTYEDTDDSGCVFTVSTAGNTRTVSWGAGSSGDEPQGWSAGQQSWTISGQ